MIMKISKIGYKVLNNELVVEIYGRNQDGTRAKLKVTGTKPFFFIRKDERSLIEGHELVTGIFEEGDKDIYGNELVRVTTDFPFNVPKIRENLSITYEADVPYRDRIAIECGRFIEYNPQDIVGGRIKYNKIIKKLEISQNRPKDFKLLMWYMDIENEGSVDAEKTPVPVCAVSVVEVHDDINEIYSIFSVNAKYENVAKILKEHAEKLRKTHGLELPSYDLRMSKVSNERELFRELIGLLSKKSPDMISGWNVTDFDIQYLENRHKMIVGEKMGISFDSVMVWDEMMGFKELYVARGGQLKSKRLEYCSNLTLGFGKMKYTGSIVEMSKRDPDKLVAYNVWDSILCHLIDLKEKITKHYATISEVSNTFIGDCLHASKTIDNVFLNYIHDRNMQTRLITKAFVRIPFDKRTVGAEVLEPFEGLARNVAVLDFTQEYPSIVRSLGISPESIVRDEDQLKELGLTKDDVTWGLTGVFYKKEPRGLFPTVLDHLSQMRVDMQKEMNTHDPQSEEYKSANMRQVAFKFLMNAFIGVMGSSLRLSNVDCYNDVVLTCRKHGHWVDEILEKNGITPIYGDTDSRAVIIDANQTPEWNIKKAESLIKFLNTTFKDWAKKTFNADNCFLAIKFEKLMDWYFQGGEKKRYAYTKFFDRGKYFKDIDVIDRLDIVGYEYVRRNCAEVTAECQMSFFGILFSTDGKWHLPAKSLINGYISDIRKRKFDIKLGIIVGTSEEPDDYKTTPIHERARVWSNKYLGKKLVSGDTLRYYYGYIRGLPKYDVFALDVEDEIPENAVIDYDHMIERTIRNPMEPIIEALGYTWDGLLMGDKPRKQSSLEE